jgi:murein L,D-transpeptidase YcbB/YkuD
LILLNRYYFTLSILIILVISACDHPIPPKVKPVVLVEKPELVNENVAKIIAGTVSVFPASQTLVLANDSLFATKYLLEFYKQQQFRVTWTNQGKLTIQGDSLLRLIKNAGNDGLIGNDYHLQKIDSLLKRQNGIKKFDVNKLCEADLLLTDAFFTYTVHIHSGRLNKDSLTREWHPQFVDTNLVQLLTTAIRHNTIGRTIHAMEPQNEQYQALKRALHQFLVEFKDTDWDSLQSRLSDSTTFNNRLKTRLLASHDYVIAESDSLVSDSIQLIKAIKNFQCRNYLTEDGKIGKLTFKALQATKTDRIHQLEMNLERCRWRILPTEDRYVWVNIPKFEMKVVDADTLIMKSRVIIGQPKKPTPLLKSKITNFLIYPYWNVPYSIATKELLPILQRDTSYLRKNNFEVLNGFNQVVDPKYVIWKKYNEKFFPWRLRQKTGDENSLGILKFNFQNKYGVYMHDTDNRRLFNREMRAMSHGCVRLEKFIDFAKFLIREDSVKYPVDSLTADLAREKQKYIYMRKPIPVYINYFTAEVNEHGELFFFIDVYKRDEKMMNSLYSHDPW